MNVILITGTSRGLGYALKTTFEGRGDRVVGYRRDELGDIRDPVTIEKLKNLAISTNVDILVNNAGVYSDSYFFEMTDDEIRQMIEVNLIAPILLTKALWSVLKHTRGTVININSVAGRVPTAEETVYRASKFGLVGFSSSLFYDGLRDGVRVIDIPFGGMNTDMLKHRPGMDTNEFLQPSEAANLVIRILESSASHTIRHLLLQDSVIDTRSLNNIGKLQ